MRGRCLNIVYVRALLKVSDFSKIIGGCGGVCMCREGGFEISKMILIVKLK